MKAKITPARVSMKKCSLSVSVDTTIRTAVKVEKNLVHLDLITENKINAGSTVKLTCIDGKQA
jgi:hypothetical protein